MDAKYSPQELQHLAEEMIEVLRECDAGADTTTACMAHYLGYHDLEVDDLFDLHEALFKKARENNIKLDMSAHDGKIEGLPFNLNFIVDNRKAKIKCPFCGSKHTARILYGMPMMDEDLKKKLNDGTVVLGGCGVNDIDVTGEKIQVNPMRQCNDCNKKFATPPLILSRNGRSAEDYRNIVTSISFSVGGFTYGETTVKISRNDTGALVTISKLPYSVDCTDDCQITMRRWSQIIDTLYTKMYLHEWKKSYDNLCVLDGTQWELKITLTNNRVRNYHGSNAYPPYWKELKSIFQKYAEF